VHIGPPDFSPESDLIIRCAGLHETPRESNSLPPLLARISDWTSVLTLAQRHGVLSLLHRSLRDVSRGGAPLRVVDVLERWSARVTARHERLRAVRDQLLDRFAGCGIAVIPLRCARLGSSPVELIEIDLLVRRRDVSAAWDALVEHGVEPETVLGVEPAWGSRYPLCARRFLHPRGYAVSLEWDVADAALIHGPSIEDVWARAVPGDLEGHPCSRLELPDLLQLLCVRGTIKRWHRLAWIREVADILAEADPAELEEALARARRCGARRALGLGTSLAGRLLGAPLPPRFTDLPRDAPVIELGQDVLADLVAPSRPLHGPWHIARFHLRSRERMRDKIRYAVRRAILPGADDVAALRLPPRFAFLGYGLAPFLRAIRAADQWVRRARGTHGRALARFGRTPPHVVDRMLALAGATPADTVYDLGCGDGAIVIRAAQRLGCRGVGVDIDEALLATARANARAAGVDHLIDFRHGDVREMDLTVPTIVCVYLNAAANLTLRPHLRRGLRAGTRLVSFNFTMGDWWPDAVEVLDETPWGSNTLYLWHIPHESAAQPAA
jgi:protein-L-isoaspartate O-methyltransferase